MNSLFLHKKNGIVTGEVSIGGSKSESNRLLILNELFGRKIQIENLSDSEDTVLLYKALIENSESIDIHHAGTAMRFLTAYFSIQPGKEVILGGSSRMKERPIGILVEALKRLGAEIQYLENDGFPPLKICGKKLTKNKVSLEANVSSQFISALMLIAPKLENGLTIQLNKEITSFPYLYLTCSLLDQIGVKVQMQSNIIKIFPKEKIEDQFIKVESDWSSASYFYSLAAISQRADLKLKTFYNQSLQGDSAVVEIYKNHFGVQTEFKTKHIELKKIPDFKFKNLELNLNETPDIAQTIAVSCAALKMKCKLSGLSTLKIKETNRLEALQNELFKIGALTEINDDSLEIVNFIDLNHTPKIKTYNDHRMGMSFAPFCLINSIEIENPGVVNKSYPRFWEDLNQIIN